MQRRALLETTTAADSFTHVSSGTDPLTISSDQAVKVEDVLISGSYLGITSDTDLIQMSSGALTVTGALTVRRLCW